MYLRPCNCCQLCFFSPAIGKFAHCLLISPWSRCFRNLMQDHPHHHPHLDRPTHLMLWMPQLWPQRAVSSSHQLVCIAGHCFGASLHRDESKPELEINSIETPLPRATRGNSWCWWEHLGVGDLNFMQKCHADICPPRLPFSDDHCGSPRWAIPAPNISIQAGELPWGGVLWPSLATPSWPSFQLPFLTSSTVLEHCGHTRQGCAAKLWISSGCKAS